MSKQPAVEAASAIIATMTEGSAKDGSNESWREKQPIYHLLKAQSHLATHLRNMVDPRKADDEDHLKLAVTRLAMALAQRD